MSGQVRSTSSVDTRALRGGPALRMGDTWNTELTVGSDSARRVGGALSGARMWTTEGDSDAWGLSTSLKFRPTQRHAAHGRGRLHRVDQRPAVRGDAAARPASPRWLLGRIEQRVWETTLRANLTMTPELTLQLYASPFAATGRYSQFRRATDTLASSYEQRFHRFGAEELSRDADRRPAIA